MGAAAGQAEMQGLLFYHFFHLGAVQNQALEGVAKTDDPDFRILRDVNKTGGTSRAPRVLKVSISHLLWVVLTFLHSLLQT